MSGLEELVVEEVDPEVNCWAWAGGCDERTGWPGNG